MTLSHPPGEVQIYSDFGDTGNPRRALSFHLYFSGGGGVLLFLVVLVNREIPPISWLCAHERESVVGIECKWGILYFT
jgi:hypothetical protein